MDYFNQIENFKDLNSWLDNITYPKKVSSSPTVIIFATMKDENKTDVCLKCCPKFLDVRINNLVVEKEIYRQISSLSDSSPNFATFLGSFDINKNKIDYDPKHIQNNFSEYDVIVLKKYNSSLFDFFTNWKQFDTSFDLYGIFIQLIHALMTLRRKHCNHNDLHRGNILIEEKKSEENLCLIFTDVDGKETFKICFKTRFIAKIYDFDRSTMYCPEVQRNSYADKEFCDDFKQCHNYTGLDFNFLFTMFYSYLKYHKNTNYLKLFTSISHCYDPDYDYKKNLNTDFYTDEKYKEFGFKKPLSVFVSEFLTMCLADMSVFFNSKQEEEKMVEYKLISQQIIEFKEIDFKEVRNGMSIYVATDISDEIFETIIKNCVNIYKEIKKVDISYLLYDTNCFKKANYFSEDYSVNKTYKIILSGIKINKQIETEKRESFGSIIKLICQYMSYPQFYKCNIELFFPQRYLEIYVSFYKYILFIINSQNVKIKIPNI